MKTTITIAETQTAEPNRSVSASAETQTAEPNCSLSASVLSPSPSENQAPPQHPTTRPKFIDTWQIPFPKPMDDLAALDAPREVPYLKPLCNRRFIGTPGPNPSPSEIIPNIEQIVTTHRA